jgi:hypothetical protein
VLQPPRTSLTVAYGLWVGSWESALVALATATESRTLSTAEVAAHKAVIADEREVVTEHFRGLLDRRLLFAGPVLGLPRRGEGVDGARSASGNHDGSAKPNGWRHLP